MPGVNTAGKLGKAPATDYGDANVLLSAVLAAPLPTAPPHFGHGGMFAGWGMLGNDRYGDCAWAGPAHEHMLLTGIGNHGTLSAKFSTAGVLSDYASTGFDPATGANDNGTAVDQLMDYRRVTGVIDAASKRHKIDLGVRLSGQQHSFDWQTFIDAVYTFKVVAVGTLVPASAMDQFNAGQPWSYVKGSPIEGGHYIPAVGTPNADGTVAILTWGERRLLNRDYFEAYVDELWVPLSYEAHASIESAAHVTDWAAVRQIATSLAA